LKANPLAAQSDLFVFSDGPKNADAAAGVAQVRELLKGLTGFRSVTVAERERNFGLAASIISGVTDIVSRHGAVIVLEDDLVTSPHFLRYMNDALELYRDREEVASIHGYIYPVEGALPETFFLRGADCWGWATWKRAWELFEPDGAKLLARLRDGKLTKAFDRDGSYEYTRMLEDQISGRNDSWAVRWYASAFLADRLTLYPGRSLVQNIGMDALGTHCDVRRRSHPPVSGPPARGCARRARGLRLLPLLAALTRPPRLERPEGLGGIPRKGRLRTR
jgi:hypothetical protein